MAESDSDGRTVQSSDDEATRAANAHDYGERRGGRATTLSATVETVRRILHADTTGIATFSATERTVTWVATSGFKTVGSGGEIVNPLRGESAERVADCGDETIIEVRGVAGDLPASEFPLHSAEGVRDLALVRLRARGENLGVLVV